MNIKTMILSLLVCLPIIFATSLRAEQELIVRMSENAFPVGFRATSGWQGMDVDVLDAMFAGTDLHYKVVLVVLNKNQRPIINNFDELINILETSHQQIGHVIGVSYSPLLDDNIENNKRLHAQIWNSATRAQIVEMLHKDRIFGFFRMNLKPVV